MRFLAGWIFFFASAVAPIFACGGDSPSSNSTEHDGAGGAGGSAGSESTSPLDGSDTTDASQPAGCPYQAPQTCPASTPTYQADVLPILQTKCNDCHTGADGGPWPLTDYQLVVDWKISILGDLECNTMPPADAGLALTSDERSTLLAWLVCGTPQN